MHKITDVFPFLTHIDKDEYVFFLDTVKKRSKSGIPSEARSMLRQRNIFNSIVYFGQHIDEITDMPSYFYVLRQFAIRFGGKYLNRYSQILRSVGVSDESISESLRRPDSVVNVKIMEDGTKIY